MALHSYGTFANPRHAALIGTDVVVTFTLEQPGVPGVVHSARAGILTGVHETQRGSKVTSARIDFLDQDPLELVAAELTSFAITPRR
ncbi:hypothetical protein [Agromyces humi]|uniref:hypothetical protein n=1 Tax=Agromyces humi TaxID=1766800 RepID=UPI00135B94D7|nr:hypothetical protein [Agromyces humi]